MLERILRISLLLISLFSFSLNAGPVQDFMSPGPRSEKRSKPSGEEDPSTSNPPAKQERKPEKKEPSSQDISPPRSETKVKKEKEEQIASDPESSSKSKRVQRRKRSKALASAKKQTKEKEKKEEAPKKYENAVPGVSALPAKTEYDPKKQGGAEGHGKGIPVLCYHHLSDNGNPMGGYNLDPSLLEEQFKYLKSLGYQTLSLDQFYQYIQGKAGSDFPARSILLTFDDGSLTHRDVLVPLLKKYGFRASVFIYPTVISNPRYKFYLSWAQLKEALDSGVLDIGSHTVYHPKLPAMTRAEIRQQLRDSKATLEAKTGRKVQDLAYPFGLFDVRVIEEAKSAGYRMAFTVNPGKNMPGTYAYTVHRSLIPWGQSQSRFNSILSASPPTKIRLGVPDGSWVKPGETFSATIEGLDPNSIAVKISGKEAIAQKKSDTEYIIRIPEFKKTTSYPAMVVLGKTSVGKLRSETQFLFVNRREFKRDPD
ncbi:polysaccharide deacetylase family protein [Leptospira langatensis]|uniref:Polysaccharide deacetylase family protein n=1 Tax=Leptospira langatensis TaxID=2484983 RepID=A0A5F1ZQN0_9LEPT|nr:polysaccharide deacetylase family protein [Leptospira langatensis]TGK01841.1 polysaccharide deacetylase family protein [Leptospira langatensis]TGL39446.1 polysaccharide deacetylase family protein [Leptospira langatensis]